MNTQQPHAPPERALSRRSFLAASGGLASCALTRPAWAARTARRGQRDVLVHVFLRGAMDGLTTCVPHGDAELYAARPTLAIAKPGSPNGALDLDGFFGLAPAAAPLLTPYLNEHLAIVHATGSTDPTRSHFDAFQHMEYGIPEQSLGSVSTGWLARHLSGTASLGGALRGAALNQQMPRTLAGAPETLPIPDLSDFDIGGDPASIPARRAALIEMYADRPAPLGPAALQSFLAIELLKQIDFDSYVPQNGAVYPEGPFGDSFRQTAALIKADVGIEAVMLELGGWDTHAGQGPVVGTMANLLMTLTATLEAFYLDSLAGVSNWTVLVMSEFGRRVAENGSAGTDHGHGNCMIVMGGGIAGGQVLTQWPGLAPGNLDGGDLRVTIDYRDIVAEILERRLGNTDLGAVFPNYTPVFRGITL